MFDTIIKKFTGSNDTKIFSKPTATVKDVHNDFDNASDDLLNQAQGILKQEETTEEQELLKLKELGFSNIQGVKEVTKKVEEKEESEKTLKLVNYYKANYPDYKFITKNKITSICQKYGLIFGEISHFIGTIPAKNRKEIINFKSLQEKDCHYTRWVNYGLGSADYESSYDEYANGKQNLDYLQGYISTVQKDTKFRIVATVKDFDLKDKQVVNYEVRLIDKDPIVLMPCNGGYLIVSKWGDEENIV